MVILLLVQLVLEVIIFVQMTEVRQRDQIRYFLPKTLMFCLMNTDFNLLIHKNWQIYFKVRLKALYLVHHPSRYNLEFLAAQSNSHQNP